MISSTETRIDNGNGHTISANWFRPEGEVQAAVLIVPAMGVPQRYYASFATWLAERGYLVATFDYVGMGQSRNGHLRDLDVDILDWARHDCSTMLSLVANAADDKPLYWIGHSLGGQILPFVEGAERISKVLTIATGSGYWRENTAELRRRVWLLWFLVAPLATPLAGYFPGKRLGMVGDLPKGVITQWRRWCLDPEYAVGAEGERVREAYSAVRTPITSISFTDDEMMSGRNTESLHGFYRQAEKHFKRIAPADVGEKSIGHFGFFKPQYEQSLWQGVLLPELA
ncbi:alpha/beta fold hydrolase [Pseudomonas sp. TCU-HL1]|uniref:alpha/beta hydrolase family protein n=1 Tax=Pseudomonas sp. TCU-HL1 TaxID=1856685 RepID=UPI00083D4DAC|nr:alpha/beta fold hydrolase [Pseudomonas sp. TCU-HL1]AOE86150.1 alpha/beta hydrolase [Pseudomonas sp. TCU-HL1]